MIFNREFNDTWNLPSLMLTFKNRIGEALLPEEIRLDLKKATNVVVRVCENTICMYFYNSSVPLKNNIYLIFIKEQELTQFKIVKTSINNQNPNIKEIDTELRNLLKQYHRGFEYSEKDYIIIIQRLIDNNFKLKYLEDLDFEEAIIREAESDELSMQIEQEIANERQWTYKDLCDYYGCEEDDWP